MIKHLTISEARKEINKLANKITPDTTISVTSRGKEILAIIPWETYETIIETLEILSDSDLMEQLQKGVNDIKKGKVKPWEQVKEELNIV